MTCYSFFLYYRLKIFEYQHELRIENRFEATKNEGTGRENEAETEEEGKEEKKKTLKRNR